MKKLLFVLAIGAFAACSSGENKEAAKDSSAVKADTTAVKADTAAKPAADTTAKADSTVKK
jgi:uncharacterized protein YcfL